VADRLPAARGINPSPAGRARLARHAGAAAMLAWRSAPSTVLALAGLAVLGGAGPVVLAWLTRSVLDSLRDGGPVLGPVLAVAATGVVVAVVPHGTRYASAELDRRAGLAAQDRLFGALNSFAGLSRLEDPRFQDRFQLAGRSGGSAPGRVVGAVLGMAASAVGVAGFVGSLVVLSPIVSAVVVLAALPGLFVQLALGRRSAGAIFRVEHAERRQFFYARLLSTVDAAKEIRLFGTGRFFRERMLDELNTVNVAARRVDRHRLGAQAVLALLGAAVAGAGLVWMVGQARTGRFTVGDLSVFIAAVTGVQVSLIGGFQHAATAHESLLLFDHYQAVVTAPSDLPVLATPRPVPPLRHGIALRDVWFRYSAEHDWVLRGLDLFIPAGSTTAIVGLNGAGKSTLVKLLCRFYDPNRGAVHWDGTDIRQVDPAALRDRVAAVFQDLHDYDLSATENIAVGDLTALGDPRRVEAAARLAGVHDTLAALPYGYDTPLTRMYLLGGDTGDPRDGVRLSGGQWQRVALARAFLRDDRDLVILDEPSAGLDAQAEAEVNATLLARRRDRTTVLISHRLSAVRHADFIVVVSGGRVAESGTHAELLAREGEYARLFRLQADAYLADDSVAVTR
jgi:ATP-binding cassette subfamily B protein